MDNKSVKFESEDKHRLSLHDWYHKKMLRNHSRNHLNHNKTPNKYDVTGKHLSNGKNNITTIKDNYSEIQDSKLNHNDSEYKNYKTHTDKNITFSSQSSTTNLEKESTNTEKTIKLPSSNHNNFRNKISNINENVASSSKNNYYSTEKRPSKSYCQSTYERLKQNNNYLSKNNTSFSEFDEDLSTKPIFQVLSHDLMDCMLYHPESISSEVSKFEITNARFINSTCTSERTRSLEYNFVSVLLVEMALNRPKTNTIREYFENQMHELCGDNWLCSFTKSVFPLSNPLSNTMVVILINIGSLIGILYISSNSGCFFSQSYNKNISIENYFSYTKFQMQEIMLSTLIVLSILFFNKFYYNYITSYYRVISMHSNSIDNGIDSLNKYYWLWLYIYTACIKQLVYTFANLSNLSKFCSYKTRWVAFITMTFLTNMDLFYIYWTESYINQYKSTHTWFDFDTYFTIEYCDDTNYEFGLLSYIILYYGLSGVLIGCLLAYYAFYSINNSQRDRKLKGPLSIDNNIIKDVFYTRNKLNYGKLNEIKNSLFVNKIHTDADTIDTDIM